MSNESEEFYLELSNKFRENNSFLYLVGGTVRDILLGKDITNYDLVTPSEPDEVVKILEGYKRVDAPFKRYGVIQISKNRIHYDIVTLREEKNYGDSRHPLEIRYVETVNEDVKRRDFTINGMYMDEHHYLIDLVNGKEDLDNKIIRMIGKPKKRLTEDPLRIIRAVRFALDLDFTIETSLDKAMVKCASLIKKLNKDKVAEEVRKIKCKDKKKIREMFHRYGIDQVVTVEEGK